MKTQKHHKYLTPLLIFLLLFSISLSYTYISPSLIKVAKIISSENSQYFLDFTNDPALKVLGSIITERDISARNLNASSSICINNDCISSWNSLSGIPSGYCVLFYNATCPSGFDLKENLTEEPFLDDFSYVTPITITDTSGTTLTDYQVKITLDTQSLISQNKMKSNCGDIRFYYTNSSGTYEIPYWIEDGTCNTPNTNIWIKVPEIPANNEATVYMYYGNSSVASESNIDDVFIFADDFNDGVIDTTKWNIGNNPSENYGILIINESSTTDEYIISKISMRPNITLDFKAKFYSGEHSTWAGFRNGTATPLIEFLTGYPNTDNYPIVTRTYVSDSEYYPINSFDFSSFHIFEIKYFENVSFYIDNNLIRTHNIQIPTTFIPITFYKFENGDEIDIDWVFIRNYASSEPTVTLGAEQPNEPEYKLICCKQ